MKSDIEPSSISQVSDNTPLFSFVSEMNLDIFITELGAWAHDTLRLWGSCAVVAICQGVGMVEWAKRQVLGVMVPRNGLASRPFSPVGVGGMSAMIGLSGMLFGHNGVIKVNKDKQAATIQVADQSFAGGGVLASDIMVDASTLKTTIPEGRGRDEVIIHEVEKGETLSSIGQKYNVTLASIRYVNNMSDDDAIKPGQKLTILPVSGVLHKVKKGETLQSIAKKWDVPAQAIVEINWLDEPYSVKSGDRLVIPNADIPQPTPTPTRVLADRPSAGTYSPGAGSITGTGRFAFPTNGYISQRYSYYHNGIDIGTLNSRPPIVAADSGRVTFAGWWNGGGGYSVWIDHGNGYVTQYAHMSRIAVSVGQSVGRGQQIGNVGDTGMAFGYHLHFNVLLNGHTIDPMSVL